MEERTVSRWRAKCGVCDFEVTDLNARGSDNRDLPASHSFVLRCIVPHLVSHGEATAGPCPICGKECATVKETRWHFRDHWREPEKVVATLGIAPPVVEPIVLPYEGYGDALLAARKIEKVRHSRQVSLLSAKESRRARERKAARKGGGHPPQEEVRKEEIRVEKPHEELEHKLKDTPLPEQEIPTISSNNPRKEVPESDEFQDVSVLKHLRGGRLERSRGEEEDEEPEDEPDDVGGSLPFVRGGRGEEGDEPEEREEAEDGKGRGYGKWAILGVLGVALAGLAFMVWRRSRTTPVGTSVPVGNLLPDSQGGAAEATPNPTPSKPDDTSRVDFNPSPHKGLVELPGGRGFVGEQYRDRVAKFL